MKALQPRTARQNNQGVVSIIVDVQHRTNKNPNTLKNSSIESSNGAANPRATFPMDVSKNDDFDLINKFS